jgi:hypothetical protein
VKRPHFLAGFLIVAACASPAQSATPANEPTHDVVIPGPAASPAPTHDSDFADAGAASAAPVSSDAPAHHGPVLRATGAMVNGRLPPEVVARIVRQNLGRFRLCYEEGLRTNAALAGTVSVKFVIDAQGNVTSPVDDGSTLPDPAVVACFVKGFSTMVFPAPAGGVVTVLYPVTLQP